MAFDVTGDATTRILPDVGWRRQVGSRPGGGIHDRAGEAVPGPLLDRGCEPEEIGG
jgi:hypothetical protein